MQLFISLRLWEVISIVLAAVVGGMYWGPWLALSRTFDALPPARHRLPVVRRMNLNMATLMTILVPLALVSTIPVLLLSFNSEPRTFYLTLAGFALFVAALVVTVAIEVPIVEQMSTWTVSTLPDNWQQRRDRWMAFHILRVGTGIVGLICLVVGTVWRS